MFEQALRYAGYAQSAGYVQSDQISHAEVASAAGRNQIPAPKIAEGRARIGLPQLTRFMSAADSAGRRAMRRRPSRGERCAGYGPPRPGSPLSALRLSRPAFVAPFGRVIPLPGRALPSLPAVSPTGRVSAALKAQLQGEEAMTHPACIEIDGIVDKAPQALPARQCITDRLRKLALLTGELELFAQPGFNGFDERPAAFQPDDTPLICVAAADGRLNVKEGPDFLQRFAGDRRRRSYMARSSRATRPTQSASVEGSRSTPWRATICPGDRAEDDRRTPMSEKMNHGSEI